ncbi:MAG: DtxR family transcriptional regulator [Anaerolineae bacterium]|nr:DtxR family transcriptional regulator [Anaerolineae bacterium]
MSDSFLTLLGAILIAGVIVLVMWPGKGLWARWQRSRQLTKRVLAEDALKHIHQGDLDGRHATVASLAGALQISMDAAAELLAQLQTDGMVEMHGGDIALTPQGRDTALHIVRAHRLWERHLADETGYDAAEWHARAESAEHALTPEEIDQLAARLGNPTHDPHGDPIPGARGTFIAHDSVPLPALAVDTPGRIVHVEDEPDVVYAQLVAEGLHPGQPVRVVEVTPQRVRFWANGDEHVLAPMLAANISVVPLAVPDETVHADGTLADLALGAAAEVVGISRSCRGSERRRFLDLGIVPGTVVSAELRSPGGEPTAYNIRGALIALRREQAERINVNFQKLAVDSK